MWYWSERVTDPAVLFKPTYDRNPLPPLSTLEPSVSLI